MNFPYEFSSQYANKTEDICKVLLQIMLNFLFKMQKTRFEKKDLSTKPMQSKTIVGCGPISRSHYNIRLILKEMFDVFVEKILASNTL